MGTLTHTLKKYRYLRITHHALKVFAKNLGYKYTPTSGVGGAHLSNGFNVFEIQVGRDQPLEDRVVAFSHELGHALDIAHCQYSLTERRSRQVGYVDLQTVSREVAGWGYGRQILIDMNCWRYVEERFYTMRETCLETYISAAEIQKNAY